MSESPDHLPGPRHPAPGLVPAPVTEAAPAALPVGVPVPVPQAVPETAPGPGPAAVPGSGSAAEPGAAVGVPAGGTPAAPEPLGVALEMTGNAEVDAAVERLGDADGLPVEGHIEVYEDVHQGLREVLAALDENRG